MDLRLINGELQATVELDVRVREVVPGTPLTQTPTGWMTAVDEPALLFAAEHKWGGDKCRAWGNIVIETPGNTWNSRWVRISEVDDVGRITVLEDDNGPHLVTNPHQIILRGGF